jgi:hypothetical protein
MMHHREILTCTLNAQCVCVCLCVFILATTTSVRTGRSIRRVARVVCKYNTRPASQGHIVKAGQRKIERKSSLLTIGECFLHAILLPFEAG